jgi:phage/plasmid-associated DNA primase
MQADGQLVRMVSAHHVVWGSEVEIAGILARELSDDRFGRVVRSEGAFWVFEGTQWSEIPEQRMRLMVHKFDGARIGDKGTPLKVQRRTVDGVLSELGTLLGKADFFEQVTVGINAANGAIILDEAGNPSLRPHSADDRFRFTIPADFVIHDDMEPPDGSYLHHLLSGAFRGDADAHQKQQLVGEMLGAAALGLATRLPQPKAFVFLGESASNGKSTIARLLSCLLPAGSVSSIPPAAFGDERRIINLAGKAANVADELSASAIAGEAFKAAVTGDPLEGRDLYRSAVTFRPRALHCFTTNTLPRFNGGLDRGLQRRLVVVRFNRSIPESEIIPDIAERIRRDELHLLLQFAVAGAQRLIRNKAYTIPASSKEALQGWLMLDPVNEWFSVRVKTTDSEPYGGWPTTGSLYADFKKWALEQGHADRFLPPVNTFSQRIKVFPDVQIKRLSRGSVAAGIKLNDGITSSDTLPSW